MKSPTKHIQLSNRGLAIFIKSFALKSLISKNKTPGTVRVVQNIVLIMA